MHPAPQNGLPHKLGERDLEELAALERRCFPQPWTTAQLKKALGLSRFQAHGVRIRGRLAAYLTFYVTIDEMEIVNLAVVPELRRRGLGRKLLQSVLQVVDKMGIEYAFLEVRASNVPAVSLYAAHGFVQTGVRRRYYPDNHEDALVMTRKSRAENVRKCEENMGVKFIDDVDVSGRKCIIRVDYNVPLKNGEITDDLRIRASLPTLEYALEHGASLILCSHLGKPKGKVVPELSLKPAAKRLGELLGRPVVMAPDCIGPEVEKMAAALKPGDVLMLENLRFHEGEQKNDPDMAKQMAALADVFVCDAFGTAHRAHASMVGIPAYSKACCGGFLLKKEWDYLGGAVENPKRPFVAVSGGAKVSSKLGLLTNLLGKVDSLLIGGAMANTFLAAKGFGVGRSLVETDLLDEAKKIMAAAEEKGVRLAQPVDFAVSDQEGDIMSVKKTGVFPAESIPDNAVILDVGPETVKLYAEILAGAETVVWNGPMGAFENPDFSAGSFDLAKAMADIKAVTIVGGGDSAVVIKKTGLADKFSFISTGGGASMEFLEGRELPAFKALKEC